MKAIYYNLILAVLLVPALTMANNCHPKEWKGKYTKEKKINKEFDVSADATLKIQNDYGNLDLTTWEENRIVIEVIIKTNGDDEEKVKEKLNDIDVDFEASRTLVSAHTLIDKQNNSGSWWSSWTGKSNNVNMEINYIVKLPATNSVDLDNDYGNIALDRLEGRATIDCDYGKITIGELLADGNYLTFDYTSGCTFDYIKSAKIDADYSGYTIEDAGNLEIDTDYTNGRVISAENVKYISDYGGLELGRVNNLQGDGDYFTLKIGKVEGNVQVNADYGSIKIEELLENAGNIDINSDYSGIKIGYNSNYQFNFEIDLSYASLSGEDNLNITYQEKNSYSKEYKGYYGSKNAKNNLRVNSDYGGLKLYKQ